MGRDTIGLTALAKTCEPALDTHCLVPTCKHIVIYRHSYRIYVLGGFYFFHVVDLYFHLFNKNHLFPVLIFTYLNVKGNWGFLLPWSGDLCNDYPEAIKKIDNFNNIKIKPFA